MKEGNQRKTRVSLGDMAVTPTRSAAPNREPISPASALLVSMGMDTYATVGRTELAENKTKKNVPSVEKARAGCRSSLQSCLFPWKCCPFEHLLDISM